MAHATVGTFEISPERGCVSCMLSRPSTARTLLVLGHGAGTNARHPFMERLAQVLAAEEVATFRYNYPYSDAGQGGMDTERVRLATVRAAVVAAGKAAPDLPRFAGGHSMSGRMIDRLCGIVAYAFPLHQPGRPGTTRAQHLADVDVPTLFLSGDRDRMARLDLLRGAVDELPTSAHLHVLEGADHGYKVLKRSGRTIEKVLDEAARVTSDWMLEQIKG